MRGPRNRLGRWGEGVAARFLQEQGYQVVTANYRCPWGEIDLVARDGETLIFVEVRTRRGAEYGMPEESITRAKAQRLVAACQEYLQRNGGDEGPWRIDLVCVRVGPDYRLERVDHLPHAVQL